MTAIVALPEITDLTNGLTDDAHVTLVYADELPPELITVLEAVIAAVSRVTPAFVAHVSGKAELGDNDANVVLLESHELETLRELLMSTAPVAAAVAASEHQFPGFIPHLTLSYGESVDAMPDLDKIRFDRIALWVNSDEHGHEHFLTGHLGFTDLVDGGEDFITDDSEQDGFLTPYLAALTAAGKRTFNPALHPRGPDGRFIKKWGIAKWVDKKTKKWGYGRVVGINLVPGSAKGIEITLEPTDVSGAATGEPDIVKSPKELYEAPKVVAHLQAKSGTKTKGQAGSNPGGFYKLPAATAPDGKLAPTDYYVKKAKSANHANNEVLANALYRAAGVPVPDVDYDPSDGNIYSRITKGQQNAKTKLSDPEWKAQVQRNFAVDAWLSSWDVFGLTHDNILTDTDGTPVRIDSGGSLLYRAMGSPKGSQFGNKVIELESLRTSSTASPFYGKSSGMTMELELDGAQRILAISPADIDDLVAANNMPKSLADTLKARRRHIAEYYSLELPESVKPVDTNLESTSAPVIDPSDIAEGKGTSRDWASMPAAAIAMVAKAGDVIRKPDGTQMTVGKDSDGNSIPVLGQKQALLNLQLQYPNERLQLRQFGKDKLPRPEHDATIHGNAIPSYRWQRGDVITDAQGKERRVLAVAPDSTFVLVKDSKDGVPYLLSPNGDDIYTVKRWDPPTVVAQPEGLPTEEVKPEPAPPKAVPSSKTTSAAADIKEDLVTNTAQPDGKGMLLGDGTIVAPGAKVVSQTDGKTYVYLKKKGPYAVVVDPDGPDPEKQYSKKASTLTQPGGSVVQTPAGPTEPPKTKDGTVPAVGMMATGQDGWHGKITMISPDGNHVFITDAAGKRKRKSTKTVTINSESPQAKAAPAPESVNAPEAAQDAITDLPDSAAPDDVVQAVTQAETAPIPEPGVTGLDVAKPYKDLDVKPGDEISPNGKTWYKLGGTNPPATEAGTILPEEYSYFHKPAAPQSHIPEQDDAKAIEEIKDVASQDVPEPEPEPEPAPKVEILTPIVNPFELSSAALSKINLAKAEGNLHPGDELYLHPGAGGLPAVKRDDGYYFITGDGAISSLPMGSGQAAKLAKIDGLDPEPGGVQVPEPEPEFGEGEGPVNLPSAWEGASDGFDFSYYAKGGYNLPEPEPDTQYAYNSDTGALFKHNPDSDTWQLWVHGPAGSEKSAWSSSNYDEEDLDAEEAVFFVTPPDTAAPAVDTTSEPASTPDWFPDDLDPNAYSEVAHSGGYTYVKVGPDNWKMWTSGGSEGTFDYTDGEVGVGVDADIWTSNAPAAPADEPLEEWEQELLNAGSLPSFNGYTPQPDQPVLQGPSGDYLVKTDDGWQQVNPAGDGSFTGTTFSDDAMTYAVNHADYKVVNAIWAGQVADGGASLPDDNAVAPSWPDGMYDKYKPVSEGGKGWFDNYLAKHSDIPPGTKFGYDEEGYLYEVAPDGSTEVITNHGGTVGDTPIGQLTYFDPPGLTPAPTVSAPAAVFAPDLSTATANGDPLSTTAQDIILKFQAQGPHPADTKLWAGGSGISVYVEKGDGLVYKLDFANGMPSPFGNAPDDLNIYPVSFGDATPVDTTPASFHGFTPQPDQAVIKVHAKSNDNVYMVQTGPDSWQMISDDGTIDGYVLATSVVDVMLGKGDATLVHGNYGQVTAAPPTPVNQALGWEAWSAQGLTDPAGFHAVGWDEVKAAVGSDPVWVYLPDKKAFNQVSSSGVNGIYKVHQQLLTDDSGQLFQAEFPSKSMADNGNVMLPGAGAPAPAQVAKAATAMEPATPVYPGSSKPDAADIAAWGADLTKDGFIPSPGMYVKGKGPMTGKILSVNKANGTAKVLTDKGVTSNRKINALSVDGAANYTAYAPKTAPVDVPKGLPVGGHHKTPDKAIADSFANGSHNLIMSDSTGVRNGEMTTTATLAPDGTKYVRVSLTLTNEQRKALMDKLTAGPTAPKVLGDWVLNQQPSGDIAVGWALNMKSTPSGKWLPEWNQPMKPTHKVTSVTWNADKSKATVQMENLANGQSITVPDWAPGYKTRTFTWDPTIDPNANTPTTFKIGAHATAAGWQQLGHNDAVISTMTHNPYGKGKLKVHPGEPVPLDEGVTSFTPVSGGDSRHGLRRKTADGVVIEVMNPAAKSGNSWNGVTSILLPAGTNDTHLNAALHELGIGYAPMTQNTAKHHVLANLASSLQYDRHDIDSHKGMTEQQIFDKVGKAFGLPDIGWHDVLVGTSETTGKTVYHWNDRVQDAIAAKAATKDVGTLVISNSGGADHLSNMLFGAASGVYARMTGIVNQSMGNGAGTDSQHHATGGNFNSRLKVKGTLPPSNPKWSAKKFTIYNRLESVLARITDHHLTSGDSDSYGNPGQGANSLDRALSQGENRDWYVGNGFGADQVGFIGWNGSEAELSGLIKDLKAKGVTHFNGRPVEDVFRTQAQIKKLKMADLPRTKPPSNARPILDLPVIYTQEDAVPGEGDEGIVASVDMENVA